MNETPQNEAAPSPTIDLYGMKVLINDLFPPNFIGLFPGDTRFEYVSGDVTSHCINPSRWPQYEAIPWHDLMEVEPLTDLHHEVLRMDAERRIARFERDFLGTIISTGTANNNITSNATPIDAAMLLADIERLIVEAEEAKRERDRALVETFLDAGFRISVSSVADKPLMILTEEFREVFNDIMDERLREQAA